MSLLFIHEIFTSQSTSLMPFPTLEHLQGIHLHPPVLRKNQAVPPLPTPPGPIRRIATVFTMLIKAVCAKFKSSSSKAHNSGSKHEGDSWSMETVAHNSTVYSESFVTMEEDN